MGQTSVLFIVIDTLRADHLGTYGYDVPTSPRIDALAGEGVQFNYTFANAPWTRPSLACLYSGLYPRSTGVTLEEHDALPFDVVTLDQRLRAQGYLGLGVNSNPTAASEWGFGAHFDSWVGTEEMRRAYPGEQEAEGISKVDSATVTATALALVDQWAAELEQRPYYLQVLYIDPHKPRVEPEEDVEYMASRGSTQPAYDAEVRDVDGQVGALLDGLDDRGLLDNTLVVLTADHGEGLDSHPGVPRSDTHGRFLYDSVIHVPLLFAHESLPQGARQDALTSLVSVTPTVLDLLDAPYDPTDMQGASFAPLVRDVAAKPVIDRTVYVETTWRDVRKLAVRTADRKLVLNENCLQRERYPGSGDCMISGIKGPDTIVWPGKEYFDFRTGDPEDPTVVNLATTQPEATAELDAMLDHWSRSVPRRKSSPIQAISPQTTRAMQSLGYLSSD